MKPIFSDSPNFILAEGKPAAGAFDRQVLVSGFDQERYSGSTLLFIGAGGLTSAIAPAATRKGIGTEKFLDPDRVEPSNLSRQFFTASDIGQYKPVALVRNLEAVCTAQTRLYGYAISFQQALAEGLNLSCDVALCCVDNNPSRNAVSPYFRARGIPVVFVAVSSDSDHGYVFIQDRQGPCIGCLFPDMATDQRHPCPDTPAISDILQAVGALAIYAIDTLLMGRRRDWNYRTIFLRSGQFDGASTIGQRRGCPLCAHNDAGY